MHEWTVARCPVDGTKAGSYILEVMTAGLCNTETVKRSVRDVESRFHDDVERIMYSVHDDWSGEPSLYFRVLLKDRPGTRLNVLANAHQQPGFTLRKGIMAAITDSVQEVALQPYFAFRLVSEQEQLRDRDWE